MVRSERMGQKEFEQVVFPVVDTWSHDKHHLGGRGREGGGGGRGEGEGGGREREGGGRRKGGGRESEVKRGEIGTQQAIGLLSHDVLATPTSSSLVRR